MKVDIFKNENVWVKCDTCGKEVAVDSAGCFRYGWLKCCGYTMRLEKYELKEPK